MEYINERNLDDIAHLLKKLDGGYALSANEQTELDAIRKLVVSDWASPLPTSLGALSALESLSIHNSSVTNLDPLTGLTNLKQLELWKTPIDSLAPLAGLPNLTSLWLCFLPVSNLEPVSCMTNLTDLHLVGTSVSNLSPLNSLINLKFLELLNIPSSDLSPLSKLPNLEELSLTGIQVTSLEFLTDLTSLKSLNLIKIPIQDITPLTNLTNLTSLSLTNMQIIDPGPFVLLPKLMSLELIAMQINDFGFLAHMTTLTALSLCGTQISDLSPLAQMNNLTYLSLFYTPVSDLEPLSGLTELTLLDMRNTQISDLRPLSGLTKLAALNLSDCKLREIPQELYEQCKSIVFESSSRQNQYLLLSGASISTQPISIFREKPEVIRAYYDAPKVAVRESKVIFLGDGGAGKTHTIKRLLASGRDEGIDTKTTLGISINRFTAEGKSGLFDINFWDFGGQENMHAMHRCFLTERTLYVVVINNRWNLDSQARYWLDNIRSFAPDSPVILAVNLWEGIRQYGLDTNRLQQDYPNLKWVALYAAKGGEEADFNALTKHIIAIAEELDSCAMQLPVEWAAIRQELLDKAQSDTWYLDREQYHQICQRHGLGSESNREIRAWLLEWLNDLGVCFSYHRDKQTKEELGNYKVLNPRWLTSAIYILLNAAPKFYQNGIMHLGSIESLLENPKASKLSRKDNCDYILDNVSYDEEECQYILQVMRKFGLSYRVNENAEFIPALCDSEMPTDLYPNGYDSKVSYEYRYSFLPDSVVQRLMIRLYGNKSFSKVWRKGFRFDDTDHRLVTVVDAGGPNDILRIDVFSNGDNKGREVMAGLITRIAVINADLNLKPDEYIVVHGPRGEIATPAEMILQAKEQNISTLHLYSKENGLIDKNVDEILGYTYGASLIEAAQLLARDQERSLSDTFPHVINNYNFYGNIYNNSSPEGLINLLERMAEQNVQVSEQFTKYLIDQLNASDDVNAKKLANDVTQNKERNVLKSLWTGIKSMPKLATGAKTVLEDGKVAYAAAKPIWDIVKTALITHGPQLIQGAQELLETFPLLPQG